MARLPWRNPADELWKREVLEYLEQFAQLSGFPIGADGPYAPPIAQLLVLDGTGTVAPGAVVAPYQTGWYRGLTLDKTAGTITIGFPGIYDFNFSLGGAVTAPGLVSFSLRVDGAIVATVQSNQKQAAEGVEASIGGYFRVGGTNQVVDVISNAASVATVTVQNCIMSLGWRTTLDGLEGDPLILPANF